MTPRLDRIGKFELMESLGEGGLGQVFLARDTIIGREVAVKIIRRASLAPPDPQGRFLREIQAASRLSHPNLATIHEFGEKGGSLFLVMDYVPGDDLATAVRSGAIPPKDLLELLAQVCDGLAYAHNRGMLHRNLKPSNIRIGRAAGRPAPKLLDFALTRIAADEPAAAAAHLASLAYAAPETFHGGKADGRADLFSVGVLLYEALTGANPFAGDGAAAIAQKVHHEEPPALDPARFPELSPALPDLLARALAKDPARRFPTAEAMAEALRAARNPGWTPDLDPPMAATPARPFIVPARAERSPGAGSRRFLPWLAALLTLLVLGAGTAAGLNLRARHRAAQPPPPPLTVPSPLQPPAVPEPAPPAPAQAPAAPALSQTPSAAVPAAAAPPAPPVPTAPKAFTSLDQAAAGLEHNPQAALDYLEQAVAADPANERAAALRIVALYRLARYGPCSKAIRDAREAGHPLWPMALRNPPLREMLEQDAKQPRLTRRKPTPPPDSEQTSQP